jgi:hypothetical protein
MAEYKLAKHHLIISLQTHTNHSSSNFLIIDTMFEVPLQRGNMIGTLLLSWYKMTI